MKTIKILAHGGDDLIMLGKTDNTPANVVSIFNDSKGIWDPYVTEKHQYLDRPVDKNHRLFIRYYKHSQPGKRALPYEVGFLLPREVYETAGNLQVLHEQLMLLPHDTLSKCWESSGELVLPILPMAETQETPNTSLSLDAPHLLCGDSQFDDHLAKVGTSFVSSDIDTWFTQLYLVVNPYEPVESANVTVSRKWMEPSPQLPPQEPEPSPTSNTPNQRGESFGGEAKRRIKQTAKCVAIGAGIAIIGGTCQYISLCHEYEAKITQLEKQLSDMKSENEQLRAENQELQNQLRHKQSQTEPTVLTPATVVDETPPAPSPDNLNQ